ncbi:MAG: cytochrome c biogenesis CcdA family protein [Mycolicibacterium sp.]|uniref:cytochrome c biogenesis CcdA family protein n=1 Tax=Mycolicibacterium sp. TaxID=2320850 RepID=UPI003D10D0D5
MIDTAALGFALGAGLVAALNPCGFAFLPGYLGLVIVGEGQPTTRPAALARAGAATLAMAAGFVTVFGIFGLVVSPLIASAQRYLPFATVVIGVLLVALGLWLLSGRDVTVIMPKIAGGTPTARLRSMYGYGVAYAVASLSCTVAPFLAVIGTTFRQGDTVTGILAFLAYAVGMALTVGVAALAVALLGSSATGSIRRILPHINRIAGTIVLLTGLYVTYYGYYEIRLFFTDGSANDPIIEAAGTVQSWLARRVDTLGAWPLVVVLATLVAAALLWRVRTRRRERQAAEGSSTSLDRSS